MALYLAFCFMLACCALAAIAHLSIQACWYLFSALFFVIAIVFVVIGYVDGNLGLGLFFGGIVGVACSGGSWLLGFLEGPVSPRDNPRGTINPK